MVDGSFLTSRRDWLAVRLHKGVRHCEARDPDEQAGATANSGQYLQLDQKPGGESYSGKLLWPESTYLLIFFVLFPLANGS